MGRRKRRGVLFWFGARKKLRLVGEEISGRREKHTAQEVGKIRKTVT